MNSVNFTLLIVLADGRNEGATYNPVFADGRNEGVTYNPTAMPELKASEMSDSNADSSSVLQGMFCYLSYPLSLIQGA